MRQSRPKPTLPSTREYRQDIITKESSTMSKSLKLAALLFLSLLTIAVAKDHYVMDASEQVPVYPKTPFDAAATRAQLEPGNGTLQGQAFLPGRKKGTRRALPAGMTVYLFPYTPYCEEVVAMFNQHKVRQPEKSEATIRAEEEMFQLTGKRIPPVLPRKRVEFDPEWPNIVRATQVLDDRGTFIFENVKPGRYFVQTQSFKQMRLVEYAEKIGEITTTTTHVPSGHVQSDTQSVVGSGFAEMYRDTNLEQVVQVGVQGETTFELSQEAPKGR